jgi:uncharacterized protein DUF6788
MRLASRKERQKTLQQSISDLEERRAELYRLLAATETEDARRGTVTATFRRCGKPNCVCADSDQARHGPRHLFTRSVNGKTEARQLAPGEELERYTTEVNNHRRFTALSQEIVEVKEQICEVREAGEIGKGKGGRPEGAQKGGSTRASRKTSGGSGRTRS